MSTIDSTTTSTELALLGSLKTDLYIAGEWQGSSSGSRFEVLNPATGRPIASVADATPADGIRALDAAVAASAEWAATPARRRSVILSDAFRLLQERKEEFALLMTLEMGKPLAEARGEVNYGGEFLRWFSEEAVRINGSYSLNPEGTGRAVISHRPVGPSFLITPWNFPLAMATRKIAPALAAGCTIVIKPAELTPLTTLHLTALFAEVGLPAGVLNVVTTSNSKELSSPIIADTRLRKLSFTGSTPVGRVLLTQAASTVLRTSMELGGNAPFVVFADADLEAAVEGAMLAKFRNIGQACTAANRFIVHEDIAGEFAVKLARRVEALKVGPGSDPTSDIGPLINEKAVQNIHSLVTDAVSRGAKLVTGGAPIVGDGSFFEPTVLTGVPTGSRMLGEEIFGPVLGITTFATEDEAVALANDTEYGLVSYVFTQDLARGHRMIERLETGMMGLNTGLVSNASAPFGGVKQSGLGREGGTAGIHEYLESKYTLIPA